MDIYKVELTNIDGEKVNLGSFKGKTLLIVNTASQCGYTSQYDGLQKLFEKYQNKGLVVLGFPSNDFGAQEPGDNKTIKKFCTTQFKVAFPMFAKAPVSGPKRQPLYDFLVQNAPKNPGQEVAWNFEKFIVSPDGQVVGRFGSSVSPESADLDQALRQNLPKL